MASIPQRIRSYDRRSNCSPPLAALREETDVHVSALELLNPYAPLPGAHPRLMRDGQQTPIYEPEGRRCGSVTSHAVCNASRRLNPLIIRSA
jgi:hypothetical protein